MKDYVINAQVEQMIPLTDTIMQLILVPDEYVDYHAGQYLQILFGTDALSYSIANAPLGAHKYELHIRHSMENPANQALFAHIRQQKKVNIRLPLGACCIDDLDKDRPILFLAGGTGFAPIKAMIEQLLANSDKRLFELFWGARGQNDLYMHAKILAWQRQLNHFNYFSVLTEQTTEPLVSFVMSKHMNDLHDWQIVISGPFDMVYSIRDVLVAQGVQREQLFSDAFSFEVI